MKNIQIKDSKLIKIFKLLDKEELRRFKKQLQSPYFTTNKHLLSLYSYLIKDYPAFTSPKLNKSRIFTHLFRNKKYNDNKLRMLLWEFTRQLEDFLIIKEVRANDFLRKKQLVSIYGKRSQMELFKKGTFRLLEEMETLPIKDKNHFFEQQQLLQELVYHPATADLKEKYNLQTAIMDNLDLHYWSNKIWMACNILSMQKFLKFEYQIEDLDLAIQKIPTKYFQQSPPLATFVKAFYFLKAPSDEQYFQFKTAFLTSINQLSIPDSRDLYTYLLNYIILRTNQGSPLFERESFEWMKIGLDYKFFIESGKMDDSFFTNCCLIAARLKEFDWAENFIEKYEVYLDENKKEDVKILSKGFIRFYQEDFSSLIDLLLSYRFKHFKDNQRAKGLLFRSYFEIFLLDYSYFEVFTAFSYSFERFFRRDEFNAKSIKVAYLNLITTLRKVSKLIHEEKWDSSQQRAILQKINSEKIALKPWLIDKLKMLTTLSDSL